MPMIRSLLVVLVLAAAAAPARAETCGSPDDDLDPRYVALVEGEAHLDAGRPADALASLTRASNLPDGPALRRRDLLIGRAHLEAGDLDAGKAALNDVLASIAAPGHRPEDCDADPGEVRWWLAEGAVRRGAPQAAVPVWQRIWTRNPTSERADDAAAALKQHLHPVPDTSSAAGRALVRERADTLAGLQKHADALALLDSLPDDGTDDLRRAIARASFKSRDYARAVTEFGRLTDPSPQDRFDRALAASRTGDYDRAAELYRALVDDHAGHRGKPPAAVDKASFKLCYLAFDAGDLERGITLFGEHLQRYPSSKHADEALWFMGWSCIRLERWDGADAFFGRLARDHARSSLAAGAAWWQARAAGLQGDLSAEQAGLERLVEDHPDSSYAWFASRALGLTFKRKLPTRLTNVVSVDSAGVERAIALLEAGLESWAQAELRAVKKTVKGRDASLALARLLADAGAWSESRKLALPYCGKPSAGADPLALELCWPRPGGRELAEAAEAAGLPRYLPFAIMRAESGFNPTVTSWAGARGIMQLMPELAEKLWAERHPGEPWDEDMLYDAAVNMELGVAELAALQARFADSGADPVVPLVIAGYNGGASAVERWLAAQPKPLEVDRWAEDIGYAETRRYVRRVLGTLQVYRYVYGD